MDMAIEIERHLTGYDGTDRERPIAVVLSPFERRHLWDNVAADDCPRLRKVRVIADQTMPDRHYSFRFER